MKLRTRKKKSGREETEDANQQPKEDRPPMSSSPSPLFAELLEAVQSPLVITDADSGALKVLQDELRHLNEEEDAADLRCVTALAPLERVIELLRAELDSSAEPSAKASFNEAMQRAVEKHTQLEEEHSLLMEKSNIKQRRQTVQLRVKALLQGVSARHVDAAVASFKAKVVPASSA